MKCFLVRGTLTDILGDELMVLRVCIVGKKLEKNVEGKRLLEFCDETELCMANTRYVRKVMRLLL